MRKRCIHRPILCGLAALVLLASTPVRAEPGTVEELFVQGLSRMTEEAFLWAFAIKVGDPYDETRIRRQFKHLWALRLFEDIIIEAEDAPGGGKALIIKVKERPTLSAVTYDDNKEVTQTEVDDRLKGRRKELQIGRPLDMAKVFFTEGTIRDMLAEKGFLNAKVEAEVQVVTTTTRAVHFKIDPGGKTRIRKIDFTGNDLFSDRKLKGQLELTQERKWWWPWSKKNLYHPVKWDQDVAAVRNLYLSRGYLDVEVSAPIVEVRKSKKAQKKAAASAADAQEQAIDEAAEAFAREVTGAPEPTDVEAQEPEEILTPKQIEKQAKQLAKAEKKARKKARKEQGSGWVYLTVPIREGPQYSLGTITFNGNTVFSSEALRTQIPIQEGQVLNNAILELGIERISNGYQDRGHLYSNVVRRVDRRPGELIADVVVDIDEDDPYFIGRIDFSGNTATQDRVLRRELLLLEGQLYSKTLLDLSKRKINQLGYWQVAGEPIVEPIEDEKRVHITFEGQEQGRNEIQVGGGFSGVDGAFFNGVYSTRNFLGRGQIVSAAIQIGGRSNRYQLSFQEPWFLGKPYLFGINLFRRDADFGSSLRSTSSGYGLLLGKRLKRFSQLTLSYNYQNVSSTSFASTITGDPIAFQTENTISSLTPIFQFSTINNPYRPSRGKNLNVSVQMAGGPLGGDTNYIKPVLNFTFYRRAFGRVHWGSNLELGIVREFGDDTPISSSNIQGVPRFERFWLGGDTLGPRVFETRTITPLRYVEVDDDGNIVDVIGDPRYLSPDDLLNSGGIPALIEVGGDRMYLWQNELVFPFNEQAEIAMFLDVGDALFEDTSINTTTMRSSAGVELRFHLPIFPVPLRLIYGWPLQKLPTDRTGNFQFSIGRAF